MTALAAINTQPLERLTLDRAELAAALGTGTKKVDRAVAAGEIPSIKWGHSRLFRIPDVEAWLATQVVADMADKAPERADQLVLRAIAANPHLAAQVMAAADELRAAESDVAVGLGRLRLVRDS